MHACIRKYMGFLGSGLRQLCGAASLGYPMASGGACAFCGSSKTAYPIFFMRGSFLNDGSFQMHPV